MATLRLFAHMVITDITRMLVLPTAITARIGSWVACLSAQARGSTDSMGTPVSTVALAFTVGQDTLGAGPASWDVGASPAVAHLRGGLWAAVSREADPVAAQAVVSTVADAVK